MLLITSLTLISSAWAYTNIQSYGYMTKNIDPIVFPGSYDKSHLHIFFGSDHITPFTKKSARLREGCTSIGNPNDLSAYWTPTLLYTGQASPSPINPDFEAYYENIGDAEIPIPENFRVVAGDPDATNQDEVPTSAKLNWFCEGDASETKDPGAFPTSTCTDHLQQLLYFPDCANNETLESAYSGTQNWNDTFKPPNECPEGMYRIPRVRYSIRYSLKDVIKDGWSGEPPLILSSGNSYSGHGDFFNGWMPESLEVMMEATSNTDFMGITGPRGGPYDGANCTPVDIQPHKGTEDYETSRKLMGLPSNVTKRVMRFMKRTTGRSREKR